MIDRGEADDKIVAVLENDSFWGDVIDISELPEVLVERISGRFNCAKCKATYHDLYKRPKVDGVCDVCQSTVFERRKDDSAETVRERLFVYYRDTSPLIGYYYAKGNLRTVDGMAPIEEVAAAITAALDGSKGRKT